MGRGSETRSFLGSVDNGLVLQMGAQKGSKELWDGGKRGAKKQIERQAVGDSEGVARISTTRERGKNSVVSNY